MVPPLEALTPAGYDLQFGINVLGHFYLTKLLLPVMQRTSLASGNKQRARIISSSSFTNMFVSNDPARALVKDSFKGDTKSGMCFVQETIHSYALYKPGQIAREALGNNALYNQSKFGVIVMAKEFARRYGIQAKKKSGDSGEVLSISVNPGNLKTDLHRHIGGLIKFLLVRASSLASREKHKMLLTAICEQVKLFLHLPVYGAYPPIYAGAYISDKEAAAISNSPVSQGGYVIPWTRVGSAHVCADDEKLGEWLWDWLEEQVKGRKFALN